MLPETFEQLRLDLLDSTPAESTYQEYYLKPWTTPEGFGMRTLHVQRQTITTWVHGAKVTREQSQRWVTLTYYDMAGTVIFEVEE